MQSESLEKVPGCGGFRYEERGVTSDYCYDPNKASRLAELPEHSDTLLYVGRDVGVLLGRCQGDCRVNRDCRADLECFEQEGDSVPGCKGTKETKVDYCYDPNWREERVKKDEEEEEEALPDDIADILIPIEDIEWGVQNGDTASGEEAPLVKGTLEPTRSPTKTPSKQPTRPPSSNPTQNSTKEPLNTTLPASIEQDDATEHPLADTIFPTTATEESTFTSEESKNDTVTSITAESSSIADPSPLPTLPVDETDTVAVPLSPFILILDFHTPQRRKRSRHVRMLRSLVIKENLDEDDKLLGVVASLIGERFRSIYPSTYSGLLIDADFIDEEVVDAVTSAAYSFYGQALFTSNDPDFAAPNKNVLDRAIEVALNEEELLQTLQQSDDIILELTEGVTVIIDSDSNTVPEKEEEMMVESSEQPKESGGMTQALKITSIVLCSVLGATAVGLLGGYFFIRRQERKQRVEYELDESDSDGELHRSPRKIIRALPSPIRPKGTFETQESSPSPHQIEQEFEDVVVPDLSLPDLDSYSIGVESCDWSYGGDGRKANCSSRYGPDPLIFSSSASLASESLAEESQVSQASSTIGSASILTGTLTNAVWDSGRRRPRPFEGHSSSGLSYDVQNSFEGENRASTDEGLGALGDVKLNSVFQMDEGTVVSKNTLNFDRIWRQVSSTKRKAQSFESEDTDSVIDYKGHSSSEGGDTAKDRAYSFDRTVEGGGNEEM